MKEKREREIGREAARSEVESRSVETNTKLYLHTTTSQTLFVVSHLVQWVTYHTDRLIVFHS